MPLVWQDQEDDTLEAIGDSPRSDISSSSAGGFGETAQERAARAADLEPKTVPMVISWRHPGINGACARVCPPPPQAGSGFASCPPGSAAPSSSLRGGLLVHAGLLTDGGMARTTPVLLTGDFNAWQQDHPMQVRGAPFSVRLSRAAYSPLSVCLSGSSWRAIEAPWLLNGGHGASLRLDGWLAHPVHPAPPRTARRERVLVGDRPPARHVPLQGAAHPLFAAAAAATAAAAAATAAAVAVVLEWGGKGAGLVNAPLLTWPLPVPLPVGAGAGSASLSLPLSVCVCHQFVVDGEWMYAPDHLTARDARGNMSNYITVEPYES
jgi:hypothetical protein